MTGTIQPLWITNLRTNILAAQLTLKTFLNQPISPQDYQQANDILLQISHTVQLVLNSSIYLPAHKQEIKEQYKILCLWFTAFVLWSTHLKTLN